LETNTTIFHTSKEYTCSYLVVVKCALAPTSRDKNKWIEVACGMFVFLRELFVFCAGAARFSKWKTPIPHFVFSGRTLFFDPVRIQTMIISILYTQAYYAASVE